MVFMKEQSTSPTINVNFVRRPKFSLSIQTGAKSNETSLDVEITISNIEITQVSGFFNQAKAYTETYLASIQTMYSGDTFPIVLTVEPEVIIDVIRKPVGSNSVQGTDYLSSKLDIYLKIANCEVNQIDNAFAKATANINSQIQDAVTLYS